MQITVRTVMGNDGKGGVYYDYVIRALDCSETGEFFYETLGKLLIRLFTEGKLDQLPALETLTQEILERAKPENARWKRDRYPEKWLGHDVFEDATSLGVELLFEYPVYHSRKLRPDDILRWSGY